MESIFGKFLKKMKCEQLEANAPIYVLIKRFLAVISLAYVDDIVLFSPHKKLNSVCSQKLLA